MSRLKTADTCSIPSASAAIVIAMMKTNQKTSLPRMVAGVSFVWALSKNCFPVSIFLLHWRPLPADAGSASTPEGSTDKRHEEGEDAGDRQDGTQTLLWDLLGRFVDRSRQRYAGELVYEAGAEDRAYDRQHDRDHQGQQWYEQAVLYPGAARHSARDVA